MSHYSHLKDEEFLTVFNSWKSYRLSYPGWVVCPSENRKNLWEKTKGWVEPIIQRCDTLPIPYNLLLLRELIWRIEIAVRPIFSEEVVVFEKILKAFNPFPKLLSIENESITPKNYKYKFDKKQTSEYQISWYEVEEAWIELAISFLRILREERRDEEFKSWIDLLSKITHQNCKLKEYWFHEQCLFYLERLNEASLRDLLEQWSDSQEGTFWDIRKAALWAEIGEISKAESLVKNALASIRSFQQSRKEDIALLSQEGWAIFFLKAIKRLNFDRESSYEEGLSRNREAKLVEYKCNASLEFDAIRLALQQEFPSVQEVTEQADFYSERVAVSYHFSTFNPVVERYSTLYSFLRSLEISGIPLRIISERFSIDSFPKEATSSLLLLLKVEPAKAFQIALRTEKIKDFYKKITKTNIALISVSDIDFIYSICIEILNAIRQDLTNRNPHNHKFSRNKTELALTILGNLCFRLDELRRDDLFDRYLKLASHYSEQRKFKEFKSLNQILRGYLYAVDLQKRIEAIPKLLDLPILNVDYENEDPFIFLKSDFGKGDKILTAIEASKINNLLNLVAHENPTLRKQAIERLYVIYRGDGLTDEQVEKYAVNLWKYIDSETGFPKNTNFYHHAWLSLPKPEKFQIKSIIKSYIREGNFTSIASQSEDSNQPVFKLNGISYQYVVTLLNSSYYFKIKGFEPPQEFIDWSLSEAISLLEKLENWFVSEEEAIETFYLNSIPLVSKKVKNYLNSLCLTLIIVIFPRLSEAPPESLSSAFHLLSRFKELGIRNLANIPLVTKIDPTQKESIEAELRTALFSKDGQIVSDAVQGISLWICNSDTYLPAHPSDFLDLLIYYFANRAQPGLRAVIDNLILIVTERPELFNRTQIESLCIGLTHLFQETRLPDRDKIYQIDTEELSIKFNEIPSYRMKCTGLAKCLYQLVESRQDMETPPILKDWQDAARNDIFPEVKQAWPV